MLDFLEALELERGFWGGDEISTYCSSFVDLLRYLEVFDFDCLADFFEATCDLLPSIISNTRFNFKMLNS